MKTKSPQNTLPVDFTIANTGALTPSIVVVSDEIGETSQVWLWRQIIGFDRIKPTVLTWEYKNCNDYPLNGTPIKRMTPYPKPDRGISRWLFRFRNLAGRNFYGSVGKEKRELRDWLKQQRPDAILCHFGHVALRILTVANDLGIPLVVHFHGMDLSSMLNNHWYRWSLIRALPRFAAMVVVGSHQRKLLIEHGANPQKLHLIPCGVPTEEFTPSPNTSHDIHQPFRILTTSRLVPWKGVDYTLRAFAELATKTKSCELHVIGDGSEREALIRLAVDLGIRDQVFFHGDRPPAFVHAQMQQSDVFVQHSLDGDNGWVEGFGVSISEAAATGLPVIVTRCGGIPDQVVDRKTGFVLPQRDVRSMTNAMIQLAQDSELRRHMGDAGRSHMVQHFDARNQIAKLEDVLLAAIL